MKNFFNFFLITRIYLALNWKPLKVHESQGFQTSLQLLCSWLWKTGDLFLNCFCWTLPRLCYDLDPGELLRGMKLYFQHLTTHIYYLKLHQWLPKTSQDINNIWYHKIKQVLEVQGNSDSYLFKVCACYTQCPATFYQLLPFNRTQYEKN